MIEEIQKWLFLNPGVNNALTLVGVIFLIVISYVIAYRLLGRGLDYLAAQTKSRYDDIIIKRIRPRRIAAAVPLLVIYYYSYLLPDAQDSIQIATRFLFLWLGIFTLNGVLDAVNDIYEIRRGATGVAIRGYLDIVKILNLLVGIILSISLFTGQSPFALLAGLGAVTAVLLLIFRDTLLSFVASIQISVNDLVVEGDWLEVPEYNADGDVIDITLHQIKIQNWDKTISVVPTYKILETPYKNWRGMSESGGRRIKRAIHLDLHSIRFCDQPMLDELKRFDLVREYIDTQLAKIQDRFETRVEGLTDPFYAPRLTNASIYRAYVEAYLHNHPDIRKDMTIIVRQLDPSPTGLPIEVYVFANTTEWEKFEDIQAEIFDHLIAVVPEFELRVFQEPSGSDFESLVRSI